jgi:hypothetical protein
MTQYPFFAWLYSQPTWLNIQEAGPAVQYIDHGPGGDIQLSKKPIWATISWKQEVLCGTIYVDTLIINKLKFGDVSFHLVADSGRRMVFFCRKQCISSLIMIQIFVLKIKCSARATVRNLRD